MQTEGVGGGLGVPLLLRRWLAIWTGPDRKGYRLHTPPHASCDCCHTAPASAALLPRTLHHPKLLLQSILTPATVAITC